MIRRAFTMRLKPDALAEYRYHHDNVWPDLVAEIERSGIASITTFQNGLELFLVSEIMDQTAWDKLWTSQIHREWAKVMEPLMHLTDDGIVDAGELTEIFHLETAVGKSAGSAKGTSRRTAGTKRSSAARAKSKAPGKRKAVARTAGKAAAKGARRGTKKASAAGSAKGKKRTARRPK